MILYNPTVSGSLVVTGSLTTTGTITSQTLVVQTITSSIEFNTGSTRNGTLSTNTHEFTGSVSITGSLAINGTTAVVGSVTATSFSVNSNGTISSNGFWGTLHTKGAGSYSDWSVINSGGNGIMWNPTGSLNMSFGGNVGIGTSSPNSFGGGYRTLAVAGTGTEGGMIQSMVGSTSALYIGTNSSQCFFAEPRNVFMTFGTNDTERMRITGGGNVNIGRTADNTGTGTTIYSNGQIYVTTNGAQSMLLTRTSSDGKILIFYKDASEVGSISTNTYSLPSDLNFKKNINNLDLGLNLVDKLRPVSYNHKIDDEGSALSTGFIAQELEQSLTELGVNKNEYYILQHKPNEDKTQSQYWLDYTKMIPILVKSIQELSAENNTLKEILQRNNIQ
jgi:hypothetical protein